MKLQEIPTQDFQMTENLKTTIAAAEFSGFSPKDGMISVGFFLSYSVPSVWASLNMVHSTLLSRFLSGRFLLQM